MRKNNLLLSLLFLFSFFSCKKNTTNIRLKKGMVISESVTVAKDIYKIDGYQKGIKEELGGVEIRGENIIVDFQGATLQGSNNTNLPNEYFGKGLKINGKNIEIKNLNIHHYKIGLIAIGVEGLKISNSNFSYNYRCNSTKTEKGDCHFLEASNNKNLEYKSGIELNNCKNIILKNNIISNNQLGLNFLRSEKGKIYNNTINHNSDYGIKFLNTSNILIMHNYIDWNKESGVKSSFQSKNNVFAYNSISHSSLNYFGKYNIVNFKNDLFPSPINLETPDSFLQKYPPLSDGQKTTSAKYNYWGEQYILSNEWGPYNFEYPAIWLREINEDKYTFAIFGPEGNWKIVNGNGFSQTSRQSGSMPATIVATKSKNAEKNLSLSLEFIGVEFTDQFGNINPRGKTFKFDFKNSKGK
ncbi:MAG: right-handed parallel beta-helix repeat-containing protein [Saprospiraceae bacterium]